MSGGRSICSQVVVQVEILEKAARFGVGFIGARRLVKIDVTLTQLVSTLAREKNSRVHVRLDILRDEVHSH